MTEKINQGIDKRLVPQISVNLDSDLGRALVNIGQAEKATQIASEKLESFKALGMEGLLQKDPQAGEKLKMIMEETRKYNHLHAQAMKALEDAANAGKRVGELVTQLDASLKN